mgnify:CR=1 FL=1
MLETVWGFVGMSKIIYKDKRYKLKRKIKEDPEEDLDFWKSIIPHDLVLKNNNIYWFLEEITEIHILEETNNGSK